MVRKGRAGRIKKKQFDEYLSDEQVAAGEAQHLLGVGELRVNPHNYREAYVSIPVCSRPFRCTSCRCISDQRVAVGRAARHSHRGHQEPKPLLPR
jgi:hypothetical protein